MMRDGHRDGRWNDPEESERMLRLIEENAAEQEEIDNALDARYRDSPVDSAALAYVAVQQAAIAARLANTQDFAIPPCADRAGPDSEPAPGEPGELTTDAGAGSSPLASDPSSPFNGQEMSR